jgi:hypothetical protein
MHDFVRSLMHDLIIALVLNERRNGDRNVVDPLANYPHLIATLAMQKTITIVKRELAAKGVKLHDVEMRDIKLLAEAYLSSHRAELIRLAIDTVVTADSLRQLAESEARRRAKARAALSHTSKPPLKSSQKKRWS